MLFIPGFVLINLPWSLFFIFLIKKSLIESFCRHILQQIQFSSSICFFQLNSYMSTYKTYLNSQNY